MKSSLSQPNLFQQPAGIIEDLRNPMRPRRWQKGALLGKGGFARVYQATDLATGELQAVKIIELATVAKAKARAKLASEIAIHKTLNNPHIVRFISHFEDSCNVYIFLELCPHESLNELLKVKKRLSEFECAGYMAQLAQGLVYLKRQRVLHRDLKLSNIFLSHGRVVIGDFGLAAKLDFDYQKRLTVCGTPNYISPEILDLHLPPVYQPYGASPLNAGKGHSYPVDVWSMGVVMFTLLTGRPPFEDVDVKQTYQRIRENRYSFPAEIGLSAQAKSLITSMLRTNPSDRPTIEEIARHAWFATHNAAPRPVGGLRSPAETCGDAALRRSVQQLPTHARHEPRPTVAITSSPEPRSSRSNLLGSASMNFTPGAFAPRVPANGHRNSAGWALADNCRGSIEVLGGPGWVVSQWLDYSSKYGMGVILENRKSPGRLILAVYFNDSTKMSADLADFKYATYFLRYRGQPEQRLTLRIAEEDHRDADIRKKLILVRNFKAFILSENPKEGTERGRSMLSKFPTKGVCEEEDVYLRKYVRTRQAIVFALSNKTQHVIFIDGSEDEVALRPGVEVSVAMPKLSSGVRNFRLTDDIRDERLRRRVEQAMAIINGLGIHQPHGG